MNRSPQPLPDITPGTLLLLEANDWSYGRDLTPGTSVAIAVTGIRDLLYRSDEWIWVLGHRPECEYPNVDRHSPCMEVRAKIAALHRQVAAS
ncbi:MULTISPECIES: hypothetical protein [Micromonospora]|uniref:Uncharacterized protein n=1 Tax=Micromonospora craniellae TaxID=2294034 RepID=A0A372FVZ3_9ACTN|nr:hypothetical protein [Micromonospora craniellae]QOC93870.1 hypothetical protein ID554_09705 [Micromonospora craniellae]RFS44951.1 hypothetical protein D0Q02_19540 [Micromonospora craniellae]